MTDNTPRLSQRWIAVAVGAAVIGVIVAVVAVFATAGGDDAATPTATPTAIPTPTPTPFGQTPTPTPVPPEAAYRLVYREFGATEDIIWSANPANPEDKVEMARIGHREGYGIKPALSPDGKLLAYLSLPDHAISVQSSQADVMIRDLKTGDTVKVGENVDMTFAPLWAPDSKLLYVRQLAGFEFLSADVRLLRIIVPPLGENTPTPTPSPSPSATPGPTQEPVHIILEDSVSNVLDFIPVGFSHDGESMLFVQIQGGTQQGTLLGYYHPATSEPVADVWQIYLEAVAQADLANAASPPPSETVTPQPTPTPRVRLVVEMTEQTARDYDLSGDGKLLAYVVQEFGGQGFIVSRTYVADVVEATVQPLTVDGLLEGHQLAPIWRPGDGRVTFGLLPESDQPAGLVLVNRDGTGLEQLPTRGTGFDEPRSWSPDGQWLAVAHSEGDSLINRHDVKLEVLSPNGFRTTVIAGVDNANVDSVLGWIPVNSGEDGQGGGE